MAKKADVRSHQVVVSNEFVSSFALAVEECNTDNKDFQINITDIQHAIFPDNTPDGQAIDFDFIFEYKEDVIPQIERMLGTQLFQLGMRTMAYYYHAKYGDNDEEDD